MILKSMLIFDSYIYVISRLSQDQTPLILPMVDASPYFYFLYLM